MAEGELAVVPQIELADVNATATTVVVEELLLHVDGVRLESRAGDPGADRVSEPMWVHFQRGLGAEVHGVEPVVVPAGEYGVSVALAPASRMTRTHGRLYEASVVVRGVCLAYAGDRNDAEEQASSRPSFDPGQWENNPVPMPARPQARPTGGRLLRIPFTFSSATSLSVDLASVVSLRHDGKDLAVRLDVGRWMEEAVHPIVTEGATAPDHTEGTPVSLQFAEDSTDPQAEVLRRALETSMAGSFTAATEEE